ncbi:MAG: SusC/RagA family TonB-linked outer membrane protein [Mucilaginibacter sp.]|uniref:SusC/RagA family TonB-linked outer membrane protein n=1 Tax=Mucilaginibacter sp. TaxID=1882438 RepID=UPI0034E38811
MYKIYTKIPGTPNILYRKILRVMRLTTVLIIASLMQVSATTFAQKITLRQKNVTLTSVLKEIREQSGFDFYYNFNDISKTQKVSVNFEGARLDEALVTVFKGLNLTFSIQGKIVSIKKQPNAILVKQAIDVRGTVEDAETGNTLSGATVTVKNAGKSTVTDKDGGFFLAGLNKNDTLRVTFIGYLPKEVVVSQNILQVKLTAAIGSLNGVDVVSTGYQYIKPTQITGATASIGTKEFESRINTDFLSGLVNKLPGLVINNDVSFNSNTYTGNNRNGLFNIRGLSTITGNQNPLIVLDGYPTELSLNDINPNEIRSVTVLKDAAAAAVYGVRAANGVIVIDRKQAKIGATRFSFRTTVGIKPRENYSGYRWAPNDTYSRYVKSVTPPLPYQFYPQYNIPLDPVSSIIYQNISGTLSKEDMNQQLADLLSYNNNADYSHTFTRPAVTQQYNLDVSGGTNKALYYFTLGYLGNDLTQIKNNNRQLQFSARTDFNFTEKLSLQLTTDYLDRTVNDVPVPDISQLYSFERFKDTQGNPAPTYNGSNSNYVFNKNQIPLGYADNLYYPLVDVNEINTNTHTIDNRFTLNFKYLIGNGFRLSFGGIYESSNTSQNYNASGQSSVVKQLINRYTDPSTSPFTLGIPNGGYLQETNPKLTSFTARTQLDYNKNIGKDHFLNAIAGVEVRRLINQLSSSPFFGYNSQTLISQPVNYNDVANAPPNYNYYFNPTLGYGDLFKQQYTDDRYVSAYFNGVYTFKQKYSFTSSIRIDQSNIYGQDPKYRYRPLWSFGAAWNIDRENFVKHIDWLTSLKLRVAEGISGNVAKASLPQTIANATLNYVTASTSPALTLATPANSGLRWEKTNTFNTGIDFTLFRRISGSFDYYNKKSSDLLGNTQTDATKGISGALINQASLRNRGFEINLHADWITRSNFNWNTGFTLAGNTSKVLDIYQSSQYFRGTRPTILAQMLGGYVKGYPLGQQFSFRYAGLSNTGVPMVYGPDGKVAQLNTNDNPGNDYFENTGSYIPKYNFGLSNRIDIGNFYVYAMVTAYTGFKVRTPYPSPNDIRPISGSENFWQKPGDELNPNEVVGKLDGIPGVFYSNIIPYLNTYTVNGSYLTLTDVNISYNLLKANFIKNLGFSNFEVKLQASNLYTVGFNKYNLSQATGSFAKNYLTPTYTLGLFTNF